MECEGGYLAVVPRICALQLKGIREKAGVELRVAILHGSRTPIVALEAGDPVARDLCGYTRYAMGGQCYVEDHRYGEMIDWEEAQVKSWRCARDGGTHLMQVILTSSE